MIKKIIKVFIKQIRLLLIFEKHFYGKYVDIDIDRRRWAKENPVIILGEKTVKHKIEKYNAKSHQQVIYYTHENSVTKWLGLKKLPFITTYPHGIKIWHWNYISMAGVFNCTPVVQWQCHILPIRLAKPY